MIIGCILLSLFLTVSLLRSGLGRRLSSLHVSLPSRWAAVRARSTTLSSR